MTDAHEADEWSDWIEHTGNVCPVDGDEIVLLRYSSGYEITQPYPAKHGFWGGFRGITHYKVRRPKAPAPALNPD